MKTVSIWADRIEAKSLNLFCIFRIFVSNWNSSEDRVDAPLRIVFFFLHMLSHNIQLFLALISYRPTCPRGAHMPRVARVDGGSEDGVAVSGWHVYP